MNLSASSNDAAFREEVRAFIRDNLPPNLPREVHRVGYLAHGRDRILAWQRILYKQGWADEGAHFLAEGGVVG